MLILDKEQWNKAADIVVVGFGSAGAISAITAHDLGAEVLILEKQPADSHMSTSHMSGSIFISPNDASAAMTYMEHLNKVDEGLSGQTGTQFRPGWSIHARIKSGWRI